MSANTRESVRLSQVHDYQFEIQFGLGITPLQSDLPAPLGGGHGPSPEQQFAAAVGNCLAASLLFSLRKYKQQPEPITAEVNAEIGRNAEGRLRVQSIEVVLKLGQPAAALQHLERVLSQFEDFCTVTQSVRPGVDVNVQVLDASGMRLK